jgi:hypothetical protein
MPAQYWFKPKSFGYGATPTTWQGWASVLAFVALVIGLSAGILGGNPGPAAWLVWALLIGAMTLGFVRFTRRRTDGEWRWRGRFTTVDRN